jgi:hypothetical protein
MAMLDPFAYHSVFYFALIFKQRQMARYDLDAVLLLPISAIGLSVSAA